MSHKDNDFCLFGHTWGMETGTEVLRAVAAIVTAFQTAADIVEAIRVRKEKRKRKRDRDIEELLEIKILHKSLTEVSSDHPDQLKDC